MRFRRQSRFRTAVLIAAAAMMALPTARAVEQKYWELSPYTIQIELATEDVELSEQLTAYVRQRILLTLHPLWAAEIVVASNERRHELLDGLDSLERAAEPEDAKFDKRMCLTVTSAAGGYMLSCREWDQHLRRWGPVRCREVRQALMLPEQCFALLRETFAPLAQVRINEEDEKRVGLVFRGCDLPRRTEEAPFARAGEVFQPFLIRFDHAGEVVPNGITEVPWTHLTVEQGDAGKWTALVDTGIRRPFGVRRRGRTEHVAIALRSPSGSTRVRFHARHDPSQGLSGYEVFRQLPGSKQSEPLGLTDSNGSFVVEARDEPVVMLFLRSDGQVLAKVPVVPGARPLVEVPIADDSARLRAQAELAAVREQLIDIVARRTILMARVRARVKEGKLDEAKDLLVELDDLPGRSQFDQMIVSAERNPQNTSADPRIQQRIEKMFADTRALLGRFLDLRPLTELRNEVSAAAREQQE